MYIKNPKDNPVIRRIAIIGSFILTIHWRILSHKRISFGKNFICDWRFTIRGPGHVTIGDNVTAWSRKEPTGITTFSPEATVTIGNNVRLNGCEIQCVQSVTIDNDTIIGSAVIVDTDFHSLRSDRATNPTAPVSTKPIHIKHSAWIAGRCAILKGVTVGTNAVAGFGSVVTRDIPDNTIVTGNPAKAVKNITDN